MIRVAVVALILAMPSDSISGQKEREKAAARYVSGAVGQDMLDHMFPPQSVVSRTHVLAVLRGKRPDDGLANRVEGELRRLRPKLEAAMASVLAELFTPEEIAALERFQRTPEGASVLDKFPVLQRKLVAQTHDLIDDLKEELVEELEDAN